MDFSILYSKIEEYNKIFIFGHKRPDGDCYGSLNGLKNIIKTTFPDKVVFCLTDQVEMLSFIGRMDTVDEDDDFFSDGLAIVCDTSTRERIHDQRYKFCKEIIKFDHHLITDNYGTYNIVDENIPATSLLVCRFFFQYHDKLKINEKAANALYTGTVTDTGNFRLRGVNNETFELIGKLLPYGVNIEYIDRKLSEESLRTIRMKGNLYYNLKVTKNGFAYARITKMSLKLFNVTPDEAANFVNYLANIKGCPVWALFIDYPNEIRCRLRSNGPDINHIAEKYGGGGHQKACGVNFKHYYQTSQMRKELDLLVKNYKESVELVK